MTATELRARFRVARLCAFALFAISVGTASGQPDVRPKVAVTLRGCSDASVQQVHQGLRVELGALLTASAGPGVTQIEIRCDGSRVELLVDDPLTGKQLRREVEQVEEASEARGRLLALAAAELVVASWTELVTNPAPKVEPVRRASVSRETLDAVLKLIPVALPSRKKERPPVRVYTVGGLRKFPVRGHELVGLGVLAAQDRFASVGWSAELYGEHGVASVREGEVTMDGLTLGATLYMHRGWQWIRFDIGAGLRIGAARLGAKSTRSNVEASSGIGPWGWPAIATSVRLSPWGPLEIVLGGDAGYMVLPMTGVVQDRREVELEGTWMRGSLGLGMSL